LSVDVLSLLMFCLSTFCLISIFDVLSVDILSVNVLSVDVLRWYQSRCFPRYLHISAMNSTFLKQHCNTEPCM
jgi:hypothetical protein